MRIKRYQLGLILIIISLFSLFLNSRWQHIPAVKREALPQQAEVSYGLSESIQTLDPAESSALSEAKVMAHVFEGLVRYKPNSTQIEPALATSWEISPDGLSWVFNLRRNVFFHDETPFNAQAVKFSVERQLKPLKKDIMTYGSFVFGMVQSVEIMDDYKVRFHLKTPYSPFLHNLAMPWAAPMVSPSAVAKEGDKFHQYPVGTGPYYLAGWQKDTAILMSNENYWGTKAKIKSLAFTPLSPEQRLSALNTGEIQGADISGPESNEIGNQHIYIASQPAASLGYLGMFNNRPPFNNDKIRRALCVAIDREIIAQKLFNDKTLAANSILPPKILGYNSDLKPYSGGTDKARALLSAYGYPDGLDITLITYDCSRPYNPLGGKVLADIIKKQLSPAGFRVKVKTYPWHEFKSALRDQEGDAFLFGWVGDHMDPDNFLYTLLSSDQNSQTNLTRYKNVEVDRLINAAQKEPDETVRERLYYHAQQIVLQDTPLVSLNYGKDRVALRQDVKEVHLNPYGIPLFSQAYKAAFR
ncbi:ABC transporter substrate-binding protein [Desulforamulus ruminis]|uniref:ABC transporter substrate-binding protein n=1 Tax=Desulforamulus ruminis TaxID=1564 RepID=UPI00235727B1|nr:ABC transporter substrate-binding protein [Desulforamulus ruminis]